MGEHWKWRVPRGKERSLSFAYLHEAHSNFKTLLTTSPALHNKFYLEEIDSEITMDKLFER